MPVPLYTRPLRASCGGGGGAKGQEIEVVAGLKDEEQSLMDQDVKSQFHDSVYR